MTTLERTVSELQSATLAASTTVMRQAHETVREAARQLQEQQARITTLEDAIRRIREQLARGDALRADAIARRALIPVEVMTPAAAAELCRAIVEGRL